MSMASDEPVMLRSVVDAVRDALGRGGTGRPDDGPRIEGSGEPIMSPQHRRDERIRGEIERLQELADEVEGDEPGPPPPPR